jgi:phosphoserine phosphatase
LKNRFGWAADQVAKERAGGNFVVLVSASPDYFIKPLVRDMKFDLVLASVMDKARPWKLKFFCHDENKVVALRRAMGKKPFEIVRAYADSKSDVPIMSLAIEPVWIDRDTGLRR